MSIGLLVPCKPAAMPPPVVGESSQTGHLEKVTPNQIQQPTIAERETMPAAIPRHVSRIRDIIALNQTLQSKISVPLFTGGTIVNGDFAKLYDLSSKQVDDITNLVASTKQRLAEIEATRAVINPNGVDEFVISVSAFPAEGGRVYNDTLGALKDILGAERYDLYRSMAGRDFDSAMFGNFGLSETVINLKAMDGANGRMTASSNSTMDAESGYVRLRVETNAELFKIQYPEIYKKMLTGGLWKYGGTGH